jgi:hypothetical protein
MSDRDAEEHREQSRADLPHLGEAGMSADITELLAKTR